MLDDPEWLWEMYEVTTDCILGTLEIYLEEGMEVDGVMLWGDIAYRSGPMFSPRCYESVLMPHHKRIADRIHQLGGQLIYHTDGDFRPLMELMLSAGINCFHPLEVKAGLDVRQMLRDYGHRCAFFGNIDARLFQANNLDGLRKEISEKLTVAMEYGGYIFHSDHSIPPGCKLATYEAALELVEELGVYAAKAV
jgi:uroporphyrinogen-III decarboxylase